MRINVNCKICAELVSFEIEGASPQDILSINDIIEREFGPVDPRIVEDVLKEVIAGKGYKRVRYFKNCPKCGAEIVHVYYDLVS